MLGRLHRIAGGPGGGRWCSTSIASEGRLAAAGRALADQLSGVEKRPLPFVDAVLSWVVQESERRPQAGARADTSRL